MHKSMLSATLHMKRSWLSKIGQYLIDKIKLIELTANTTRATHNKMRADVHSTKPYNAHRMTLFRSAPISLTRPYNSVKIYEYFIGIEENDPSNFIYSMNLGGMLFALKTTFDFSIQNCVSYRCVLASSFL